MRDFKYKNIGGQDFYLNGVGDVKKDQVITLSFRVSNANLRLLGDESEPEKKVKNIENKKTNK